MADKSKILKEYTGAIKNYCAQNGLSFDKLRASPYCYGKFDGVDDLIILRSESDPEREKLGLMDDIPTPSTLEIYLENGCLRFVQTDITHKYLAAADDVGVTERATAKRTHIREPALA
jgi:hypothetical protein